MNEISFRLYHRTLGGHVHIRVFAGRNPGARGKSGDLVLRPDEWEEMRSLIDIARMRHPEAIAYEQDEAMIAVDEGRV